MKEWMRPVWDGGEVFRETMAMVEENGICAAPFLYEPEEILRIESYDGTRIYEMGRDCYVEERKLVLTEDSRIPRAGWENFYYGNREEAEEGQKRLSIDFGPVEMTDAKFVHLDAIGHPELVTGFQIAVTYRTKERWQGTVPASGLEVLPRFREKAKKKELTRLVLYGDSISCGYDCSGMYGQKPGQPVWPLLLKDSLEAFYQMEVELINTSVGGMASDWALEHVQENVCDYRPDLVLLGFGMNDRCPGKEYAQKTERLIDAVRAGCPEAEIVLMATSLPNPLVKTAPFYFWAYQDEYADALRKLCGPGIALADIQGVQKSLMQRKRYIDLTGNLLNHPNDYLARIQAQVLDSVLRRWYVRKPLCGAG